MEQIKNIYTQIKNGVFNTTEKLRGYIIVNRDMSESDQYNENVVTNTKSHKYMHYLCCLFFVILFIYIFMSMFDEDNDNSSALRREILDYNTTELPPFYRNSFALDRV